MLRVCAQAVDFKIGAHFGEGQGANSDWRDFKDLQGSNRKNLYQSQQRRDRRPSR
jgi:hypothetical protein